jgi:hypothetical protein
MNGGTGTMLAKSTGLPTAFALHQNFPNPFNPTTTINYDLPIDAQVSLKVFDILGRNVAKVVDGFEEAGWKRVTLDGSRLASGVYFYRITAGNVNQTRKLLLLR